VNYSKGDIVYSAIQAAFAIVFKSDASSFFSGRVDDVHIYNRAVRP